MVNLGLKTNAVIAVCSLLSRRFLYKAYFVSHYLYLFQRTESVQSECSTGVRIEPQLWHVSALPNSVELLQFILAKVLFFAAVH